MLGSKYLSEAIHEDEIKTGALNIVVSPTGSGKTTWIMNYIERKINAGKKVLFLIDTTTGRDQLLYKHSNLLTAYDEIWSEINWHAEKFIGEFPNVGKTVAITYHKFGALIEHSTGFKADFDVFDVIVCDEIQNLLNYINFSLSDKYKYCSISKRKIEEIANDKGSKTLLIALSATPESVLDNMKCNINKITIDTDVIHYETCEIKPYSNLEKIINNLPPGKGIIYIEHINMMQKYVDILNNNGKHAVAIWSIHSEIQMNNEQKLVREFIISNAQLPEKYDIVILNASYQTSINLYGKIDFMVIHSQKHEVRTQVRGRYRDDLNMLYIYNSSFIDIPAHYLKKKLFSNDKSDLCKELSLRVENSRIVGWTTVKKKLVEQGYSIVEGRENNQRYAIITGYNRKN